TIPRRDTEIIKKLIPQNSRCKITVCFYGGEPFLATEKMFEVWAKLKKSRFSRCFRFMVYTNGEFFISAINRYPEFIKDIWLYSISIDGDEQQHNRFRPGTNLKNIVRNLNALRRVYSGRILMWSTLREGQSLLNCFSEFLELKNKELVNDFYLHWPEVIEPFKDFVKYRSRYEVELETIMDLFTARLRSGEILSLIHINELILYLLTGKKRQHTACAIELLKNYDLVGGKIYYCVDLPSDLGSIEKNPDSKSLIKYKTHLGCYRCSIHFYCGGRCPVQGLLGSPLRNRQYCKLMHSHVRIVKDRLPEIVKYLKKNRITLQKIYDQSAFLTRYTDVIP
ncbi:MAG: hypothetical protein ABIL05_04560, partial [candidate division WOR-3 bacterium]